MSDSRTIAIHKAATELVKELIAASGKNGGERWLDIITRKMEQLPDQATSVEVNSKFPLRIGTYELSRFSGRVAVTRIDRSSPSNPGGDRLCEIEHWEPKDLARLKLWLNSQA